MIDDIWGVDIYFLIMDLDILLSQLAKSKWLNDIGMQPGLSEADLGRLGEILRERLGIDPPEDFLKWFGFQDGARSAIPGFNQRPLSAREALEAYDFFRNPESEFQEPYDSRWFPLLTNDSSDYLVFDVESKMMISYWHDDDEREVAYQSLSALISSLLSLPTAEKPKATELFVKQCKPHEISILVFYTLSGKPTDILKELRPLLSIPAVQIVKKLSAGEALSWDLGQSQNSLERFRDIGNALKMCAILTSAGCQPVVKLVNKTSAVDVVAGLDDLERLRSWVMTAAY